ncbi:MAG: glycoside hydrolase family 9 protein [Clostridia bacterium]|nr:glycoside hydrolase family 9 protein [Clostridia bacterium]
MEQNGKTAGFLLDPEAGYFVRHGVNVIAFEDIYPEGHQSGVSLLMHGERLAANGDVRFEPAPGQWQPVPKLLDRRVDPEKGTIVSRLRWPDEERHLRGFNPMVYPDCAFDYTVTVRAEGASLRITVDADPGIPPEWADRLCFNLELFPGLLFGKPWIMDDRQGLFPSQPVGPVDRRPSVYLRSRRDLPGLPQGYADSLMETGRAFSPLRGDEETAAPYACGHCFTCCPDDPLLRFTAESAGNELRLYDGRLSHNNGWFVLSSPFSAEGPHAVEWLLTPSAVEGWFSPPRIQVSQVGYMPGQPKLAVAELDPRGPADGVFTLWRIGKGGRELCFRRDGSVWGRFLRYRCLCFDFSDVKEPGLYQVGFGDALSSVFRIAQDVFDRGVWQPVLEYFLPVQMCHMRVSEKYRVWHGRCHMDDARMAPVGWNHFDGYRQGPETLTRFRPGECVPGLNCGGWHDAGDFDLRVESQSGEAYLLALMWETFHVEWDATTVDQGTKTVEIHQPDGKNDLLQQIEHGALAVLGGWKALGRLYRGVIAPTLRQYVLLGDAAAMTDGVPGSEDDRWVFTEDNPARELATAAHLAAVSRALSDFNPSLSAEALEAARALFRGTRSDAEQASRAARVHAAAELFLTTGEGVYADAVLKETDLIASLPEQLGWIAARAAEKLRHAPFTAALRESLLRYRQQEDGQMAHSPYRVPYRPYIWGAGWMIQKLGCEHYYLHKAFPEIFPPDLCFNTLSFILGCHPERSVSFASGIGARSVTAAYGFNRADGSYIPGGVVSGTALIRPDFPELKEWPYLWQQTEYVLGGGSSRFMFLVLAVRDLLKQKAEEISPQETVQP